MADYKGKHVVCDMLLFENKNIDELVETIEKSISFAKMNVVNKNIHGFKPHGHTAVWILSESHFTLHTYPESNYISVDCYTCGDEGNPEAAIEFLLNTISPIKYSKNFFLRGTV